MTKRTVLSDFDRTLFDTARFFVDIWDLAARLYDLDADEQRSRAVDYFRYHGDLYDYDFFTHLATAAPKDATRQRFVDTAHHELTGRYLYDDVTPEVVAQIDVIVTFGGSDFQRFKLSFCLELKAIDTHIILVSKGEYIPNTFKGPTLLIDDKRLESEIVPPAIFVRIDRSAGASTDPGVMTSFAQLGDVLDRVGR